MRFDVYVPFLVTAVLAVSVPRLGPRLTPRHAAWVFACVALMTAVSWLGSLSLLAFTALAQIPAVAQEGRWSVPLLRAEDPVHFGVAVACALVLATACVVLGMTAVRQARGYRRVRRESRRLPGDSELVVFDDESPEAFALPGRPGRIVVSRGMLRCLTDGECAALLAHERAHLRNRHHLFQAVWRLASAVNPLLRPLVGAGDFVLERWADEDAADQVGDRRVVASAVTRAALATAADRTRNDVLAATGGAVPQRVKALLVPAPRRRLLPLVAGGLLLVLCWTSLVEAASDSEQMLDVAQRPLCAVVDAPRQPAASHHLASAQRPGTHRVRRRSEDADERRPSVRCGTIRPRSKPARYVIAEAPPGTTVPPRTE